MKRIVHISKILTSLAVLLIATPALATVSEFTATFDSANNTNTTSSYPGVFNYCDGVGTEGQVKKNFLTSQYRTRVILLAFDTSTLTGENVTDAEYHIRFSSGGITNTDSRNLNIEWYDWGGTCDSADWTTLVGTDAATVALSSLTADSSTYNEIALSAPENVNTEGTTYLRLGISGDAPTGANSANTFGSTKLVVTHETPSEEPPPEGATDIDPLIYGLGVLIFINTLGVIIQATKR